MSSEAGPSSFDRHLMQRVEALERELLALKQVLKVEGIVAEGAIADSVELVARNVTITADGTGDPTEGKVTISASSELEIEAGRDLSLDSRTRIEVEAATDLTLRAMAAAEMRAGSHLLLDGGAGAKVNAGGVAELTGGLVKLAGGSLPVARVTDVAVGPGGSAQIQGGNPRILV